MNIKNDNLIIGINLGDYGSTGNIMLNSLEYANKNGPFDVIACIPYVTKQINPVDTISFYKKRSLLNKVFYKLLRYMKCPVINDGNFYIGYTRKLMNIIVQKSKEYKRTIIHIHNLHTCNINVNIFYKFLIRKNYTVLYTLHDCWTFTGGCYVYEFLKCSEWQRNCKNCPQKFKYASHQLNKRTRLLNNIKNLTLIPCSKWLSEEIGQSRLKNIPRVINNGETSLMPYKGKSKLKKELNIEDKKIIISVSGYWNDWKGIKYLYQLANILPKNYLLLLVGGSIYEKHSNIIHIPSISNSAKLSEYYSIADVFVSTTQSDNLPLVLMEAQICGLPVVGFGHGGTPEEITNKSGIMVGKDNDVNKLFKAIKYVVENKPFSKKNILLSGKRFMKYESAKRQLKIYNTIIYK